MQQPDDPRMTTYQVECPICGYILDGYQCNLVCPNCGYREDCSDAFRSGPVEPPAEERDRPESPQDDQE